MSYNLDDNGKETLLKDLDNIENAMIKLSEDDDIWQNKLLYWICSAIRHLLINSIKKIK